MKSVFSPVTALLSAPLVRLVLILALVLLVLLTALQSWPYSPAVALALGVFCTASWATGILPPYWPGLVFLLLALLLQLAPPAVVFSGFYSSAFWLLFSGMVIGRGIRHSGLSDVISAHLSRLPGRSYLQIISWTVAGGTLLTLIMPSSMGRMVLYLPVVMALAEQLGYEKGSKGYTGMTCAAALSSFLPGFSVLPSNVPNMLLSGLSASLYGVNLSYSDYLLLHFPVLGLLKAVMLVLVTVRLLPAEPPAAVSQADVSPPRLKGPALHMALVMLITLLLWMTGSLHHVAPGWVGLAVALYCLHPATGLTESGTLNKHIPYDSLFFVAAVIGLGAVLAASGVGTRLVSASGLAATLAHGSAFTALLQITGIASLIGMVTNLPGIPAVMTPMAQAFADASGLPLKTVLMTQVLAFSSVILPYQAPPLMAAVQMGYVPFRVMTRLVVALFLLTLCVLLPLDLLWWQLQGLIL